MIGRLRHPVDHYRIRSVRDALNEPTREKAHIGTYWAEIRPLSARERTAFAHQVPDATHAIVMRDTTNGRDVRPIDWLEHATPTGARTFEIQSVLRRDEGGRWLDIIAVEKPSVGAAA